MEEEKRRCGVVDWSSGGGAHGQYVRLAKAVLILCFSSLAMAWTHTAEQSVLVA